MNRWILASRPRTLPAAAVPVWVGSTLAIARDGFELVAAGLCLGFALLIQVGTNFANDYADFEKGADSESRIGPPRAVAMGLIDPGTMKRATLLVLLAAFGLGLGLIPYGGVWLVVVGVSSVVFAYAYTTGPYPLAYLGLGDVFVICYFGLIAVGVTEYVQTGSFSLSGWALGLGVGLMTNNLLVVNNYRDAEEDAKVGKKTLVVRLGRPLALRQYQLSGYVAVGLAVVTALWEGWFLVLPVMVVAVRVRCDSLALAAATTAEDYGGVLARTVRRLLLYGGVLGGGILLSKLVLQGNG
ncbi:MAG: 1,4-dihydroxy-2-naphthoate polyprenyltransferase [Puniceicoccaceae bacterium]